MVGRQGAAIAWRQWEEGEGRRWKGRPDPVFLDLAIIGVGSDGGGVKVRSGSGARKKTGGGGAATLAISFLDSVGEKGVGGAGGRRRRSASKTVASGGGCGQQRYLGGELRCSWPVKASKAMAGEGGCGQRRCCRGGVGCQGGRRSCWPVGF
uniref:DUF834 domain-containing protein n=1 Tax=Oryza barthii TaxID=65489 RepID=A0A0D3HBY4_9ORYZ